MARERAVLKLRRRSDELWRLEEQCDAGGTTCARRAKIFVIPRDLIIGILRAAGVRLPGDALLQSVTYVVERRCLGVRVQSQTYPLIADGDLPPCIPAVLEKPL